MNGRPMATKSIREDAYLPLESSCLDHNMKNTTDVPYRYFVSSISVPGVGTFGREAQAVWLLDRVLVAIDVEVLNESAFSELHRLDDMLQPFLSMILEQAGGGWGEYCSAIALTITYADIPHDFESFRLTSFRALYTLHFRISSDPGNDNRGGVIGNSLLALSSISRVVADIAYAFNTKSNDLNIDIIGPAVSYIPRCAQQLAMIAPEFRTARWQPDIEELRKFLCYINQRWTIAGGLSALTYLGLQKANKTQGRSYVNWIKLLILQSSF